MEAAWRAAADACLEPKPPREVALGPAQYLVLVTCRDEGHQVELLQRFSAQGLECRALLS